MGIHRRRPGDLGRDRALELRRRFGSEVRIMRVGAGLTQRELGRRGGVTQSLVSQVERGRIEASLETMACLAAAAGGELAVRIYPAEGVRLRDSGQMEVATLIAKEAHPRWKRAYEVPVAPPPDRRAGDMVLDQPSEVALVEIERGLADFQAQYRSAQLKRAALAEQLNRPVRLLLAVTDTDAARRAVAPYPGLLASAFPVPSRRTWAALRAGEPIGGDSLLWVRLRDLRRTRPMG